MKGYNRGLQVSEWTQICIFHKLEGRKDTSFRSQVNAYTNVARDRAKNIKYFIGLSEFYINMSCCLFFEISNGRCSYMPLLTLFLVFASCTVDIDVKQHFV